MYKLFLPINLNEHTDRQRVLEALREAGAEYALLAFDGVILSAKPEIYRQTFARLGEMIPFLKEHGYSVGVWIWSLWLSDIEEDELRASVMVRSNGSPRIRSTALNSNVPKLSGYICPTSKRISTMLDIIEHIAEYRPDMILLDDDLGYATYLDSIGCYCEGHLALMRERLGYAITREELREAVALGKPNEIRSIWYELTGKTIDDYARSIRDRIDTVDPSIRCGFCAVMSNWGTDGTTAERIASLLAGGTRPLIRLIGAPYWAAIHAWGNRLQHTIELSRMEAAWVQGDAELVAEGDVYPRPRHRVPAAFLEIYDTALRASGALDGILKIMIDYTSSIDYERGYLERHIKNLPLYEQISEIFDGKTPVGVRVYETMDKITEADFTDIPEPERYAANSFFSYAARMLSDNTIPTVYEGVGCAGIAFGENARHLPSEALSGGLILDIRAALILTERGIDVGLASVGGVMNNNLLYFPEEDERVITNYRGRAAYEILPKPGAEIVTYTLSEDRRFPDAYHYENADGQRFLVYAFDAALTDENRYRNYSTQRQLCRSIEWLSKSKLPAVCLGNPDLYMLCKRDGAGMAIGLWNIFADDVAEPEIRLDRAYREARIIGGEGRLDGDILHLSSIPPYGYVLIDLKG